MTNVLIIGHGAREHVIAETLVNNGANLYAYMSFRNAGLDDLSQGKVKIDSEINFKKIIEFGKQNSVNFAVIGPEAPLVVGIVDALEKSGIPCVGPKIEAAQIEGSKIFMRNLLEKYNISSNIENRRFDSLVGLENYLDQVGDENIVVKPDGLTGGKGVKVYGDHLFSRSDILTYCRDLISKNSSFLIEEKCEGEEFTLQTFCDGKNIIGTPLVQDHKRAFVDDKGPNTGGMGSYSMEDHLMPFISKSDVETSLNDMKQVISAIKKETGVEYKGFLYGQFMKTKKGIKLIEYNARLGDPEAMNILPLLKTNFIDICYGIIEGNLSESIDFKNQATVCKYLAPMGYPTSPVKDEPIHIEKKKIEKQGAKYYYASVYRKNGDIFSTTSRAMGILGISDTLERAERIAEEGVNCISGKLFHRKDIGTTKLLQKRIDHMKSILNS
jgi:phosphoribosylamine--glycine ligase